MRTPWSAALGLAACLLLAGCLVLAGCSAGPRSEATRTAPRPPDWRDASYTVTCDGVVPAGFPVTLRNGAARVPADVSQTPYYDYFDVRFEAAASGDLAGVGAPATVVLLQCSPQPSNGILEEAQVFAADRHRVGVLPSPKTLRDGSILAPVYDPAGLSVQNGDIVAAMKAYAPSDSHASGPSERITVRWHWDGQRFVRLAER